MYNLHCKAYNNVTCNLTLSVLQEGHSSALIAVALIVGLLVGASVTIFVLFLVHRVIGRSPYACLERRDKNEMSSTPVSVTSIIPVIESQGAEAPPPLVQQHAP